MVNNSSNILMGLSQCFHPTFQEDRDLMGHEGNPLFHVTIRVKTM